MRSLTGFAICRRAVVFAIATVGGAALAQSPDVMNRCEGPGLTPCDIVLPDHDVALTLLPGYGLTEPQTADTPARPRFDVVRLVDGETVVTVNARRAQAAYCQDGLAGDAICVTDAATDADGVGVAFVLASLGTAAMAFGTETVPPDDPGSIPGDLQGVWFAQMHSADLPDHGAPFIMMELFQDAGEAELFGYFITSPDLGPLRGATGDVTGREDNDTLALTLAAADGTPLMRFRGAESGQTVYVGEIAPVDGPSLSVSLSRVAGPGEPWSGPSWMTTEATGDTATGLLPLQPATDGAQGDFSPEDRALAELLGTLMGTVTDDQAQNSQAQSPTLAPLGGRSVDLQGLPAERLIDLILPDRTVAP